MQSAYHIICSGGDILSFPKVIGHRGAPCIAPENTLASFKKAIEMGVDGIETDVQMTKDGHIVICHDETLDRTTNGKGYLYENCLHELKGLSAGAWFSRDYEQEKIPTLEEFLNLVKDRDILINIEIKSGIILYPYLEKRLIHMLHAYGMENRVILSSFNHYSLLECKKIDRSIKTGILYMAGLVEPWEYAKKVGAEAIHPLFYSVYPEIVSKAKDNNVKINTFTVNEIKHMKSLISMDVDGIITDYPERLLDLRKKQEVSYEV